MCACVCVCMCACDSVNECVRECLLLPVSYQTVGERGQRLVVVNLQKTPLDHLCALRIYAKTDQVWLMDVHAHAGLYYHVGCCLGEQTADGETGAGDS